MKKFSFLEGLIDVHAGSCIDGYFKEVAVFRDKYPYLREYRLMPLLLPVRFLLTETSVGQKTSISLKTRTMNVLGMVNIATIIRLFEHLHRLQVYRNSGKVTTALVHACLAEFLARFCIDLQTLDNELSCAAKSPPPRP